MSNCKWVDKCWSGVSSVDGTCCGDPPSSKTVQWVDSVRSRSRIKRRKIIPGQNAPDDEVEEEVILSDKDDDDDQPPPIAAFSDFSGSHTTDFTDANSILPSNSVPYTFTITNTSTGAYDHAVWTVPSDTTVVTNDSSTFVGTWHPPVGPTTLTFELKLYDSSGNVLSTRRSTYPRTIAAPPAQIAPACVSSWTQIATENQTYQFNDQVDLAYGTAPFDPINGHYKYIRNTTGDFTFTNSTFGGDPAPNVDKVGYYRCHQEENVELTVAGQTGTVRVPSTSAVTFSTTGTAVGNVFLNVNSTYYELGPTPLGPVGLPPGVDTSLTSYTAYVEIRDGSGNGIATSNVVTIDVVTFVWCDPPAIDSANPFNATGTINGVQYVYTSSQPVITSPDIINYDHFPSYFNIPNEGSIRNNDDTDNVLTFAQPVLNPIIVIASIGTDSFFPGITVTIDFDHDFTALWSENVVINNSHSLSGHEGYVVLAFTGTISSISFHLTAESWMNLIFGAYF